MTKEILTYGHDETIHSNKFVDVVVDENGKVTAVWFRCLSLPFREFRRNIPGLVHFYAGPPIVAVQIERSEEEEKMGKAICCFVGCENPAEFRIYGESGHLEDYTESCEEHVGQLLGTPTYVQGENTRWTVDYIK